MPLVYPADASPKLAHFLTRREAIVLAPYRDGFFDLEKTQPRWSIGSGVIAKHGAKTKLITVKKSFHLLHKEMETRIQTVAWALGVRKFSVPSVPLEQHHFDAVFSLYYQGGSDGLKAVSALIQQGLMTEAADEFKRWDANRHGEQKDGLRARRELERHLFLTGDYGELNPVRLYRHDPHDNPHFEEYHVTEADLKGWLEDDDGDNDE